MYKATYRLNDEFNGIEIMFNEKPSDEIRAKLKDYGFRWHKVKKLWYAKQSDSRLGFAIGLANAEIVDDTGSIDFSDWGGETSDGYMGAIRWDGNKSNKSLYGADLSKAIRDDLKAHNIKGCTVKVHSYSMGQSITVTVKCDESDFIPYEDWKENKNIFDFQSYNWIVVDDKGTRVDTEEYYSMSEEEKTRVFELNATRCYRAEKTYFNKYQLENCDTFKSHFKIKLQNIINCVDSYRYDDSNGMVDYFNTNFYYDIDLKYIA